MICCEYIVSDWYCGAPCEGNTRYCATHNRQIRKESEQQKKQASKRKQTIQKAKDKQKEPRNTPNKVSEKRKELNKEYSKLAEDFKRQNPDCYAKIENICTGKTEDVHHTKGRGKYLLEVSSFLPVCRNCHIFITDHPADSLKRGLSFSRLATTEPHAI